MNKLTKTIGFFMVCGGFLWAALATVQHEEHVQWNSYAFSLTIGIVGVFLIRWIEQQQRQASHTLSHNMETITTSLTGIVQQMNTLNEQRGQIDTYDVRDWIDQHLRDDLAAFVDARQSIAHIHGLQAYADVMSSFATAERYLNRVWSASADGYIDEVNTYLTRAQEQFVQSLHQVQQLSAAYSIYGH